MNNIKRLINNPIITIVASFAIAQVFNFGLSVLAAINNPELGNVIFGLVK